jgi:predicted nucleic-acid-binding Zn-ribbon protein
MERIKKSEIGICPKCGNQELNYSGSELCDNQMFYEVDCPTCKWLGQEWHTMTFDGYYENKED